MKTWVAIENDHFIKFLEVHNVANSPENFQRFLHEIGVTTISFTKPMNPSIEVPSGSCIRLHTPEKYNESVQTNLYKKEETPTQPQTQPETQPQTQTQQRTNSCSIQ